MSDQQPRYYARRIGEGYRIIDGRKRPHQAPRLAAGEPSYPTLGEVRLRVAELNEQERAASHAR